MQEKTREYWVDALKGIAILMVMLHHSGIGDLDGFLFRIAYAGRTGVSIFFTISMYLLLRSYDKVYKNNEEKFDKCKYIQWIKKRIGSLIGLYFIAIVVYALLIGGSDFMLGTEGKISILNYITHFLCINSFFPHYINSIIGVEWYLSVLFIVILLTPWIYKMTSSWDRSIVFLIGSLFLYALSSRIPGYIPDVEDKYVYENYFQWMSLWSNVPMLALGGLLFNFQKSNKDLPKKRAVLLSYGLLFYAIFMIWGMLYNYTQVYYVSSGIIYAFIYFTIIISQMIKPCFLINNCIFRFFGKNSYPIYLTHYLFFLLLDKYISRYVERGFRLWAIKFVIAVAICILITMLYNFVKGKINALKNK